MRKTFWGRWKFRGEWQGGSVVCLEQPLPRVSRAGGESSRLGSHQPLTPGGSQPEGTQGHCPMSPSSRVHVISIHERWWTDTTSMSFQERQPPRRPSRWINFTPATNWGSLAENYLTPPSGLGGTVTGIVMMNHRLKSRPFLPNGWAPGLIREERACGDAWEEGKGCTCLILIKYDHPLASS